MKSIVMALIAMASITASAKLETGLVCQINYGDIDSGVSDCRVMTYHVNAPSDPSTVVVRCDSFSNKATEIGFNAEDGTYTCPYASGKVPRWLKAINQAFIDAGFLPSNPKVDAPNCKHTNSCTDKE